MSSGTCKIYCRIDYSCCTVLLVVGVGNADIYLAEL